MPERKRFFAVDPFPKLDYFKVSLNSFFSGRSTTDLDRIALRGSDPLAPHQAHRDLVTGQQQGHHDLGLRGSDPLAAPPQGLRDPLAASSNPSHHHHHGLSPQPPVPCYRPAPDYETAVLSK